MKTARVAMSALMFGACCASVLAQTGKPELKPLAFAALDSNKDGKLSPAEARSDADLYASFASLDVNQDGFLSPDEFGAWPRALRATASAERDPTTVPGGSSGAQHMPSN